MTVKSHAAWQNPNLRNKIPDTDGTEGVVLVFGMFLVAYKQL